ncbi:probable E3 ubiquitin-protein ligase RZFP34 isoform X2 [Beta vulgaris subsp. vulgaris]|uniref:probable E3 ubiquitin-protein ligase RZFP34 isoform X2 n=1 Tax=Beta vulgaris subsp. vulgaris TaxID=3555 RepID=UPI0020366B60|nr:probable E3 ubiquitin-protein ligase RZFP34 isoform X2 [Beta vulgaris subsp. vulgaris]
MEPIETLNKSVKLQSDGKVSVDASDHADDLLDVGYMEYGCQHYQRRCRIRAPCCNEIFDCHHCHNEAMNNINLEKTKRHDIPRHQVHQVICSLCGTEQEVRQVCVNCGVCMGKYYCEICKLYDDNTSKKQYHCDGCGICRIGGRENFFHCYKCGCCYSVVLKNSHPCIEGAMHHDCPVCFEYLFESRNDVTVLPCGHTIHKKCLDEMQEHCQCGRNLTWKLLQHQCPNLTRIRWSLSFAMTVSPDLASSTILLLKNVLIVNLTTLAN